MLDLLSLGAPSVASPGFLSGVGLVMGLHLLGPARTLIESKNVTRATDIMRRAAGGVIVLVGAFFVYSGLS
jgi:hypothetical protein